MLSKNDDNKKCAPKLIIMKKKLRKIPACYMGEP